jgi:hypothetical protein
MWVTASRQGRVGLSRICSDALASMRHTNMHAGRFRFRTEDRQAGSRFVLAVGSP